MGLSEYIRANTYEMLTNESYAKSETAMAEAQQKAMKKQSGVGNNLTQGFSNGMQRRMYNSPMVQNSENQSRQNNRRMPSIPDDNELEDIDELQAGD